MADTPIETPQPRLRAVHPPPVAALVRTGAIFDKAALVEHAHGTTDEEAA